MKAPEIPEGIHVIWLSHDSAPPKLAACRLDLFILRVQTLDLAPHPPTSANMSWRSNVGQTGANTIPLGKRRFGDDESPAAEPQREMKRGRSPERRAAPELNPDGTKKRRKRNRWGDAADNKAAGLMNLPTAITAPMTAEQLDAYVTHLRIEEISQKLRINDVVPADGDR
jgi:splicing factor 1